jgi:hypothetical protein
MSDTGELQLMAHSLNGMLGGHALRHIAERIDHRNQDTLTKRLGEFQLLKGDRLP